MTYLVSPAPSVPTLKYVSDLLAVKEVPSDLLSRVEGMLATQSSASNLIVLLKRLPKKVALRKPVEANVAAPAVMRDLPVGFYTVEDGQGGHVTFRVSDAAWADGKRTIGFLKGSNNERSYRDFAFVAPEGFRVFKAHKDNARVIAAAQFLFTGSVDEARAEFMNQAEANALESGTCLACLRLLTVGESVRRGLGPVCAKRLGA